MKQKDIALIIVIGFMSLVFAVVVSKLVFNGSGDRKLQTSIVPAVTTDFSEPDKKYFNEQSINPTQKISINENNNNDFFGQ